jgi:hypothetical protein
MPLRCDALVLSFRKLKDFQSKLLKQGRVLFGVLLVAQVLFLNLLVVAPSLHEWFHADAGHEEHQCAVTMFAHGQVDAAAVNVPVSVPLVFAVGAPQIEFSVFRPAIENLPAGRGPPLASVNS